jgi:hypothetical protein
MCTRRVWISEATFDLLSPGEGPLIARELCKCATNAEEDRCRRSL